MGYELGITEVGPPEYPLIEVLRQTVFGEAGHVSLTTLAEDLQGKADVLCLIAHLEGNPVGFKVGHRDRSGIYYSKCGGVLKDYRRLGLAGRMLDWQHRFAKARGYKQIYFNTFNHFPEMILFGLRRGYRPVGAEAREPGGMSFKFAHDLEASNGSMKTGTTSSGEGVAEIENQDAEKIYGAISSGLLLAGIRHDFSNGKTFVLLDRKRDA